jgi:hypothetical protein
VTAVQSSNLAAVSYNLFAGVLTIAFHGNRIYQYFGVPPGIYLGLMQAESHGKYFHCHIRNAYRFRRVQ